MKFKEYIDETIRDYEEHAILNPFRPKKGQLRKARNSMKEINDMVTWASEIIDMESTGTGKATKVEREMARAIVKTAKKLGIYRR